MHFFLRLNLLNSRPFFPLSISYLLTKNVCMLMVCDVGKVVDITVSCLLCVCFRVPPVSLTACHFRQIFQSVTFLQKWNHRTLRIKWFHMIFHRLVFLHLLRSAASFSASVPNPYRSNGQGRVSLFWKTICHWCAGVILQSVSSHCMTFSGKVCAKTVNPVTVSVSRPCSASQHDCCAFIYFLAFILSLKKS